MTTMFQWRLHEMSLVPPAHGSVGCGPTGGPDWPSFSSGAGEGGSLKVFSGVDAGIVLLYNGAVGPPVPYVTCHELLVLEQSMPAIPRRGNPDAVPRSVQPIEGEGASDE